MKIMSKTLYVRSFNENYHSKLSDISQQQGVSVGSIIEEAVGQWIKNKNQKVKQHNLILYSNEEELIYFLKKMEDLTKQDWNRICLGPENHKGKEFLKKKQWKDVTVLPYVQGLKNAEKYASKVFGLADKESSGKNAMFVGFMTGDVASRFNLKKSIELEKISNNTINSGIVFCPFKISNLTGSNMEELFDLIGEHDKVFVIKNNEIFEMNLDKINHSKLLLT
jgi:hypothetical protein